MKTKVAIPLPCVSTFHDYHDIEYLAEDMKRHFGVKIKCFEVCSSYGRYIGCFYVGVKPTKKEVESLMEKAGISVSEEND